ncbi:hypothetical protein CsSME_00032856 [Camellia sinensis var. sinensis]
MLEPWNLAVSSRTLVATSVDELKIIAEEELVNKAFEEAFKDVVQTGNSSEVSEEQSNAGVLSPPPYVISISLCSNYL